MTTETQVLQSASNLRTLTPGAVYGQPLSNQRTLADGTTVIAPAFDARFNIDTRFPNDRNKRAADFQPIVVTDVRRYKDQRGSPRVALNSGSIHLSLAQIQSAGVFFPEVLVKKHIMVDFFKPGDILLNGSQVAQSGIIVNQFQLEPDMEVAQAIQKDLALESHRSWASLLSNRVGANNRGTGEGMRTNTDNGVTATSGIPAMQPASTQAPATQGEQANSNIGGATAQGENVGG